MGEMSQDLIDELSKVMELLVAITVRFGMQYKEWG